MILPRCGTLFTYGSADVIMMFLLLDVLGSRSLLRFMSLRYGLASYSNRTILFLSKTGVSFCWGLSLACLEFLSLFFDLSSLLLVSELVCCFFFVRLTSGLSSTLRAWKAYRFLVLWSRFDSPSNSSVDLIATPLSFMLLNVL